LGGDALGDMGGGGGFGGGDPSAVGSSLVADDATLQAVAEQTGGTFYRAGDTDQLRTVFEELPRDVDLQTRQVEITAAFAALGALLAGAAIVASIRLSPYP
jgi:Ca-activated chloride channel family protein